MPPPRTKHQLRAPHQFRYAGYGAADFSPAPHGRYAGYATSGINSRRLIRTASAGGNLTALGYVPQGTLDPEQAQYYEELLRKGQQPEFARRAALRLKPRGGGFFDDLGNFVVGSLSGFAKDVATGNFSPGAIGAGIFAPSFETLEPSASGFATSDVNQILGRLPIGESGSNVPVFAIANALARGGQAVAQGNAAPRRSGVGRALMPTPRQPNIDQEIFRDVEQVLPRLPGLIRQGLSTFKQLFQQAPVNPPAPQADEFTPPLGFQPTPSNTLEIPQVTAPTDQFLNISPPNPLEFQPQPGEIPPQYPPYNPQGGFNQDIPFNPQGGGGGNIPPIVPPGRQGGGGNTDDIDRLIHQSDDQIAKEEQQDEEQSSESIDQKVAYIARQLNQLKNEESKPASSRDIGSELALKRQLRDKLIKLKKVAKKVRDQVRFCMTCQDQEEALKFLNGEVGACVVQQGSADFGEHQPQFPTTGYGGVARLPANTPAEENPYFIAPPDPFDPNVTYRKVPGAGFAGEDLNIAESPIDCPPGVDPKDCAWARSLDPELQRAAQLGFDSASDDSPGAQEGYARQGYLDKLAQLPGYASDPRSYQEVFDQAEQGAAMPSQEEFYSTHD